MKKFVILISFISSFILLQSTYIPTALAASCQLTIETSQSNPDKVTVRITGTDSRFVVDGPGINEILERSSSSGSGTTLQKEIDISELKDGEKITFEALVISTSEVCDTESFTVPQGGQQGGLTDQDNDDLSTADSVSTGLGNISTDPNTLIETILTLAIGVAGGIAFLLIVYGGFRLVFSQGDPKAVQEGRDIITSAIVGLIIIIFSVFILNLIGISILGLPLV